MIRDDLPAYKFTETKRFLETPNRSGTEKMTYCLLDYDPVTNHLSITIFINVTQLKIQLARHAVSTNKTLITGLAKVLQLTP